MLDPAMARLWNAESASFFKRNAAEQQQCPAAEQQQQGAEQQHGPQCADDGAAQCQADDDDELAGQEARARPLIAQKRPESIATHPVLTAPLAPASGVVHR